MEPRTRVFLTIFILVIIIFGLYLFTDWFSKATGYVLGEDQKIKFAECLNEKSSTLFLTANCADCEKQATILGDNAYSIIKKVTCGADLCNGGIRRAPAWEIEGKLYYGFKTYKELDELSGCEIK